MASCGKARCEAAWRQRGSGEVWRNVEWHGVARRGKAWRSDGEAVAWRGERGVTMAMMMTMTMAAAAMAAMAKAADHTMAVIGRAGLVGGERFCALRGRREPYCWLARRDPTQILPPPTSAS